MANIKEFNLLDVRKNSQILSKLNEVYKLFGYEEVSPSMINDLDTLKAREVINQEELVTLITNKSLCLRPEMTTSIVKLTSTRLINKKRPIRLWNNGTVFERIEEYKNNIKLKEKIQSGIELIGYQTKFPEIEIINILFNSIDNLKLKDNCNLIFLVSSTTLMDLILQKYKGKYQNEINKNMINLDQDNLNKLDINKIDLKLLKDILYTRGEPLFVLNKLRNIFGPNKVLEELIYLFNTIGPLASKYKINIQLDPTFQPHLNLYEGIVFQLICVKNNEKYVIAKGGRYDELVKFLNPNEKVANGIGFSISIDNLRKLIKEDNQNINKVLIVYSDKNLLPKALEEQKKLHNKGIASILEINVCDDENYAIKIMNENDCNEIIWIN